MQGRQVRVCRLFGLLGVVVLSLIGGFRLLLPHSAADPVWMCFGMAGLLGGLFVATFESEALRRHCAVWMRCTFCLLMVWAIAVVVLNQATGEYVLGLMVVYAGLMSGVGLTGQSVEPAWWFAGGGIIATAVGFFLGPEPQVHPVVVLVSMAAAAVGVGGGTQAHLSIQAHLREQRGQWQHLMGSLQEAVMITVDGKIAYANDRAATLFGASTAGALQGCSVFDILAPDSREEMQRRLETLDEGPPTEPLEHRAIGFGGEERIVQSQSVPVQYDGEEAVLSVVRDISHWREAQEALRHRANLEHVLVEISAGFIDTPISELDQAIEEALGTVGPFVGADRSYVFLFDGDPESDLRAATGSNTHEWCAQGIVSQKAESQNIPCEHISWWMEKMAEREPLIIPSVANLPEEADGVKEILEAQNIHSLVALPLTQGEQLIGFVGCDAVGTYGD